MFFLKILKSLLNDYRYSKFLVDYHWLFLLAGVVICLTLTGTNFIKQPLPDFSDPKRVIYRDENI